MTVGTVRLNKVPLLLIPFRKSKGELLPDEKEQPAPTLTCPVNMLDPPFALSEKIPVPERSRVEPAVKADVLVLSVPVTVIAPVNVVEPVVPQVMVPSMAEVPVTVEAAVPDRVKVVPAAVERLPEMAEPALMAQAVVDKRLRSPAVESDPLKVTAPAVLESVRSELAVAAPVNVTAPVPDMVCAPVKVTVPAPLWLKAPVVVIPPWNSNGAVLLIVNVPELATNPSNLLTPPDTAEMIVPAVVVVPNTVKVPVCVIVVVADMVRDCRVILPAPLTVKLPSVVNPPPVKSMFPVVVKAPLKVTGTAPELETVIPVATVAATKDRGLLP